MDDIPLSTLLISLAVLLGISGFFSISETTMMAANRYRLRHRAQLGQRGPRLVLTLLRQTDKLLGVILLGNTLVNAIASMLTAVVAVRLFGAGEWALMAGTIAVTFAILVFSEITPKVVGAAYADRIAPRISFVLAPLLRVSYPLVWFVNLFVRALLKALRLEPRADAAPLSQEELRTLVLEGGHFLRGEHRNMLANLFDLEKIRVDDVMTPRSQIDALDLGNPVEVLREQLATSYHTRLPVYEATLDNVIGVLHLKQVLHLLHQEEFGTERLRGVVRQAYYIPAGTPLLTQLRNFQDAQQRMGLVVDEYGELLGLLTLEDIVEEIIGEFTTSAPGASETFRSEPDGSYIVDGGSLLRTLNRKLGTGFPLSGPKTLSGLIVEHLGEIPETGVSFRLGAVQIEILHAQDRAVRMARLTVDRKAEGALPLHPGV